MSKRDTGARRPSLVPEKARARATNQRLNGVVTAKGLVATGDGRTVWARRYRDTVVLIANDLGGIDALSELKLGLVRRAACLMLETERLESRLANGEIVDIDLLARLSSHLRRIAESIGLDRVTRDRAPSIAEIAERHRRPAERREGHGATPIASVANPPAVSRREGK